MCAVASDRRVSVPRLAWHITRRKRFDGPKAPGPSSAGAIRSLLWMLRNPLASIRDSMDRHGELIRYEFRFPGVHFAMHLVTNPLHAKHVLMENQHNYKKAFTYAPLKALMGNGLLTSEGDLWLKQRRLMQPIFGQRRLETFYAPIRDAGADFIELWRNLNPDEPIEIGQQMSSLTLDIVGRALFGSSLGDDGPRVSQSVKVLQGLALKAFTNPAYWLFATRPQRIPIKKYRQAVLTFDDVIYGSIDKRRHETLDHEDLLGMLLAVRDETTGEPMGDVQIRDELMTFMLAGHETTATALTWTFYLLSQNEPARRALLDEIDGVVGGRMPTFEDVPRLVYSRAVLQESMRLYPPAWLVDREAIHEDEVGGCYIPAGSTVTVTPYFVHRHPEFWPDAEAFQPQRFLGDAAAQAPAYIPFGAGRRGCIGSGFAMLEGVLALVMIAQSFELQPVAGHPVEPRAEVTLTPRYGMPMFVRPRAV
jgi:cytochrome P450